MTVPYLQLHTWRSDYKPHTIVKPASLVVADFITVCGKKGQ